MPYEESLTAEICCTELTSRWNYYRSSSQTVNCPPVITGMSLLIFVAWQINCRFCCYAVFQAAFSEVLSSNALLFSINISVDMFEDSCIDLFNEEM
jgi:hypothetical protein